MLLIWPLNSASSFFFKTDLKISASDTFKSSFIRKISSSIFSLLEYSSSFRIIERSTSSLICPASFLNKSIRAIILWAICFDRSLNACVHLCVTFRHIISTIFPTLSSRSNLTFSSISLKQLKTEKRARPTVLLPVLFSPAIIVIPSIKTDAVSIFPIFFNDNSIFIPFVSCHQFLRTQHSLYFLILAFSYICCKL